MSWELIASAVIPLVVAALNLLVAGYALTVGLQEGGRRLFFLGPGGVGVWAVAWFVSVFNPDALATMQVVGTVGGILAIGGFAGDALVDLDAKRRGIAVAIAVVAGVAGTAVVYAVFSTEYEISSIRLGGRVVALALVVLLFVANVLSWRTGDPRIVRWSLAAVVGTGLAFVGFFLVAVLSDRTIVDTMLFVVLLAEVLALVYVLLGRVSVHVLFARAVTYVGLAVLIAAAASIAYAQLGYELDAVIVSVTVAVALGTAATFTVFGDQVARRVEFFFFPARRRMERALAASHGEVRAMRRRLERVEKLAIAGELAASVAHEIKNPLAPIRGYAQMLRGRIEAVDEGERAQFEKGLSIIQTETERIDQRIQELLAIARGDKEGVSSDATLVLNDVVTEAAAVAEGEPGLGRLVCKLDARIDRVVGDADEVRGALLNLMKNAAEAMVDTDGQRVDVVTTRNGVHAIVEVIDEGPGVPEETADLVFGAFFTTKAAGTGLGLAIARSAIEAAGGTLTLTSREDRRGAVARIVLDLVPEEERP
ncbi:MAG: ATP-binding protein [Deltaproteobacteria bacterium]